MEWNEYWNNYQDWKYPVTVIFCLFIGFLAGWFSHKDKCEKEKHAKKFLTACGVYDEKPKSAVEDGNY